MYLTNIVMDHYLGRTHFINVNSINVLWGLTYVSLKNIWSCSQIFSPQGMNEDEEGGCGGVMMMNSVNE